jgi:cell division transport system ATP-binding protein
MIKFTGVTKKYPDGTVAVANVSFEIADGEFVFFVGPSGAGKTTLLRMLVKDMAPTSGEILVDEHDLSKVKDHQVLDLRRKIGFVFQDLKLLPDRSVFENIALSLWVLGKSGKDVQSEVNEKLKLVGLEGKGEFFPAQLSGGELQRVAIARALAGDPKYLIADEPTGNVDDANAWKIMKILDRVNKSGITVIMATHNTEIVDTMDKRVVRLEDGHLASDKKGKYR